MAQPAERLFLFAVILTWSAIDLAAADPPVQPEIRISASATGVRRYSPGEWSAVGIQAGNLADVEGTGTIVVYFNKETQYQFARQMWVPPKSVRTTWLPVRVPKQIAPGRKSFDMTLMPLVGSANREVVRHREGQEMLRNLPVPADVEPIKTAAIFRKGLPDGSGLTVDLDVDAYELMAVVRESAEFSRVILEFAGDFVPPHPVMWESLDQLIICGDRIIQDSAGLTVLRNWLFRGGKLCVFLDRTSPETVAAILGHANSYQVIDRVELDDFTIEDLTQPPGHPAIDRRRFETPAELVRVVADGAEVHCRINGWPAAFWQRAGEGRVLFLALSPNGWRPSQIQPGSESLPESKDAEYRSQVALSSLGMQFFQPRSEEPTTENVVQPILQEQIGYRIPSRTLATSLLGLNGMALLIGGVWLARRNHLDRLALLVPVLSIVTTAVFLVIGSMNNRSVPPSVAFAQLIRFMPDLSAAHVSGVAAMYQQQSEELRIAGGPNGLLLPLATPADGTLHRLLWTDAESGHWLNVSLPAGSVQFATMNQSVGLKKQISVRGQFGPRGFAGQLPLDDLPGAADALIAALPGPSAGVRFEPDGSFVLTPEDVYSEGQFLHGTVVSDASRRRQDVYRNLLTSRENQQFASQPTLFTWIQPLPGVITIPADTVQRGSALAAIPLWIERTPPATEFTIPTTFLPVESVIGERGRSLAYNSFKGTWIQNASRTTNTRLRFQLPAAVRPCRLTQANLTIKVNAPSRELLVNGVVEKKDTLITRIPDPSRSRVYQVSVDRPEWLTLDERGGVLFSFVITEAEQERLQNEQLLKSQEKFLSSKRGTKDKDKEVTLPSSFTTWQIDYVHLDVRGITNDL